jgi:hypothetical protein
MDRHPEQPCVEDRRGRAAAIDVHAGFSLQFSGRRQ